MFDWRKIGKRYMKAMAESPLNIYFLKELLKNALSSPN
jgi:hypothetical protein